MKKSNLPFFGVLSVQMSLRTWEIPLPPETWVPHLMLRHCTLTAGSEDNWTQPRARSKEQVCWNPSWGFGSQGPLPNAIHLLPFNLRCEMFQKGNFPLIL